MIQALKENTKSNLLSTPSILTMDNEEAYIVVGENVPFVTGSVSTTASGQANPYTTIERKDVGVTLKVVPHIGEGGSVRLEVEQEVSNVTASKGQAQDLVTSKRAIKNFHSGGAWQIIVLGGLISDDTSYVRQAVPGLGAIPGLGRLFRADGKSNKKRSLLIFIHPTIVGDAKDVRKIAAALQPAVQPAAGAGSGWQFHESCRKTSKICIQPRVPVSKIPYSASKHALSGCAFRRCGCARGSDPVAVEPMHCAPASRCAEGRDQFRRLEAGAWRWNARLKNPHGSMYDEGKTG